MNARAELGREAEAILYAGGFRNAAAKHHGPFWTVYGVYAGNEHSGHTQHQADPQDPRELARVLVARVQAEPDVIADEPEAPETVEETFAPGQGPFDAPFDAPPHVEPPEPLVTDADYTLPEIELIPPEPDPTFGSELLEWEGELAAEPEPEAAGAFIFGDNLEQKRTAAIGLVVQAAVERLPSPINYEVMNELRNFAMGVAEGRWANDSTKQAELALCEAVEARRRHVERARDEKVAYLVAATREQIEAFDPSEGWP